MKHIIIIILTLLSITINAQGIRLNSKQSVIDSTRLNATGDSLYYYQNGVVLRVEEITGVGSVDLASQVTGTLPVANGGTGATSLSGAGIVTGTGTTNYIPKFTSSSAVGNGVIYDNGTNVGIGTTSPASTLHVAGTGGTQSIFERTGSNGVFVGFKDGSGNFAYIGNTNGVFSIQTLGSGYSDKLIVTSAGNVGIGTNSPAEKLDVNGEITVKDFYNLTSTGGTVGFRLYNQNNHRLSFENRNTNDISAFVRRDDGVFKNIFLFYYMTGKLRFRADTVLTDNLAIFEGNVGIGTTSPDSKLEVNGSATNTSANNEGGDATIDFSLSNIAYTSNTGNSITLTNIKDGGAYTLISTATSVSSAVAFTVPTGFSIIGMGTVARTIGKRHIYSFIVADGNVYVTMGTEN